MSNGACTESGRSERGLRFPRTISRVFRLGKADGRGSFEVPLDMDCSPA
jgi:hypothetical protein